MNVLANGALDRAQLSDCEKFTRFILLVVMWIVDEQNLFNDNHQIYIHKLEKNK